MNQVLKLHREPLPSGLVVRVEGRLAFDEVDRLSDLIIEECADRDLTSIVLDMSKTEYMDSRGAGVLIRVHKHCLDRGISLTLREPCEAVLNVLRLTNLDHLFRLDRAGDRETISDNQSLAQSFHYSQQLMMALGEGVLGLDPEGRILMANRSAVELLGEEEDELVGRSLSQLIAVPSDPSPWRPPALLTASGRRHWVLMHRRRSPPFEATLAAVAIEEDGRCIGVLVGFNDRSDLEEMRRTLRETQRRLTLMVQNTSDAMLYFNIGGRLLLTNPAAERLTGYDSVQLRDRGMLALAPQSDRDVWRRIWDVVSDGEAMLSREMLLRRADGSEVWCSVSGVPVIDETSQTTGLLFTLRDIDESRRMRIKLQKLEMMQALGRLASGFGRDCECLIAREQAQLSELSGLLGEGTRERHLVAEIQQQHAYMKDFVRRVRMLDRESEPCRESHSVGKIVDEVLERMGPVMSSGVHVSARFDPALPGVRIKYADLVQIVRQICKNSVESMGGGGRLKIWSEPADLSHEELVVPHQPVGRFIRLCIEDSGSGMPPEVRHKAFDPYFSTKESHCEGLGLSLVYGIVRQYDGWVEIDSREGEYTRVTLYLPTDEKPAGSMPTTSVGDKGQAVATAVTELLVVDDEELVLNFSSIFLERAGYTVHRAESPQAALEIIKEHGSNIQLAIIDLSLPGMSGQELIKTMNQIRPELKILVSSGLGEHALNEVAEAHEVHGILRKPYRGEDLLNAVRSAFNGDSENDAD